MLVFTIYRENKQVLCKIFQEYLFFAGQKKQMWVARIGIGINYRELDEDNLMIGKTVGVLTPREHLYCSHFCRDLVLLFNCTCAAIWFLILKNDLAILP